MFGSFVERALAETLCSFLCICRTSTRNSGVKNGLRVSLSALLLHTSQESLKVSFAELDRNTTFNFLPNNNNFNRSISFSKALISALTTLLIGEPSFPGREDVCT